MEQANPQGRKAVQDAPLQLQEEVQQLLDATIFMVDDEPITMEVVQAFLEQGGYRNFVLIEKSSEAMASLEKQRADLLLLDLVMPEVSGFDILKAVRAHPKLSHLPIIVLTSSLDYEDKLTALDLGATDFLAKPVDPSELQLRVRNTLAAKAYMDQLAFYDPLTKLPNRHLFLEQDESATISLGYSVITTRNKLRGKGRALSLKFTSEPGKDLQLLGWSIELGYNREP